MKMIKNSARSNDNDDDDDDDDMIAQQSINCQDRTSRISFCIMDSDYLQELVKAKCYQGLVHFIL